MKNVVLAPSVVVDGITWNLFSVEFETADGKFGTYIYAIDHGHAALVLEELKSTARIAGIISGIVKP